MKKNHRSVSYNHLLLSLFSLSPLFPPRLFSDSITIVLRLFNNKIS